MNDLPDVNEMYPQEEPPVYDHCKYCKEDVFKEERKLNHGGHWFCDTDHLGEYLVKIGLAEWLIVGE